MENAIREDGQQDGRAAPEVREEIERHDREDDVAAAYESQPLDRRMPARRSANRRRSGPRMHREKGEDDDNERDRLTAVGPRDTDNPDRDAADRRANDGRDLPEGNIP